MHEQVNPLFSNEQTRLLEQFANLIQELLQVWIIDDNQGVKPQLLDKLLNLANSFQSAWTGNEVVVYCGMKDGKVVFTSQVGSESQVHVPYAGDTDALKSDFDQGSNILIIHSHPSSSQPSTPDAQVLVHTARSFPDIKCAILVVGKDHEPTVGFFDQIGRYTEVNLGDIKIKRSLSPDIPRCAGRTLNKEVVFSHTEVLFALLPSGQSIPETLDWQNSPPDLILLPGKPNGFPPNSAFLPDGYLSTQAVRIGYLLRFKKETWPSLVIGIDGNVTTVVVDSQVFVVALENLPRYTNMFEGLPTAQYTTDYYPLKKRAPVIEFRWKGVNIKAKLLEIDLLPLMFEEEEID